jgi:hypothetical protein
VDQPLAPEVDVRLLQQLRVPQKRRLELDLDIGVAWAGSPTSAYASAPISKAASCMHTRRMSISEPNVLSGPGFTFQDDAEGLVHICHSHTPHPQQANRSPLVSHPHPAPSRSVMCCWLGRYLRTLKSLQILSRLGAGKPSRSRI